METKDLIQEAYCSFELAKLLKEKGFDAECRAAYTNYGKLFTTQIQQYITNILCSKGILWECIAPTLQMALKWLREVHNIDIIIFHEKLPDDCYWARIECHPFTEFQQKPEYKSYEEAVEAGIKYTLENLI